MNNVPWPGAAVFFAMTDDEAMKGDEMAGNVFINDEC